MQTDRDLLSELLSLLDSGEFKRFAELCRENVQMIAGSFAFWLTPPASIAEGSARYHAYMNGLYLIAKHLGDDLGVPGLFGQLVAPEQSNPFAVWEAKINQSLDLNKEMRWDESYRLLSDHLIDYRDLSGFGYSHMAATTHWYCSQYRLNDRDREGAIGHGEQSLSITRRIGDHPKYLLRYLMHLWQAHRYFGDAAAGNYAKQLADFHEQAKRTVEARYYRRQAEFSSAGEPLTRVAAKIGGQDYEMADLPADDDGKVSLFLMRNRMTLVVSMVMVREARASLDGGDTIQAFDWLRQAAKADPHDPQPHMFKGSWLLSGGSFYEAVEAFEECERLGPGWPGCRRALWLARKLAAGELGPEVVELWSGNWQEALDDKEEMLKRRHDLAARYDRLALPRLLVAEQLKGMDRLAEAERAYREGLERDGDESTRTWLLLALARATADLAEQKRLAQEAVRLDGDPLAAAAARLMLRKQSAQ